jgi:hypothetical protein
MLHWLAAWLRQTSTRLGLIGIAGTLTTWYAGDIDGHHATAGLVMGALGLVFNDQAPEK